MKKILVPCDFSDQAVAAFRVALDIAKQSGGEVNLINIIEVPIMHDTVLMPTLNFEEALFKEMEANAKKQFEKLKVKFAKDFRKVKTIVTYGITAVSILNHIEENNIDMVVMGTKGASGLSELLIGSNAEKVVRRSPVPVLVVKKYVKLSSLKRIVFPSTLEKEHEDLVMGVKRLQSFLKATLDIVFINTPTNFSRDTATMKQLNDFARRFMLKDYTLNIYNDTFEESGVINFTHSIKADMIAMGTHGRKGLSHILSGSVTEDVVNHVDCPIWTYAIKD
ncbi:MAG TPA: universal stress protein [Cyclobacteriaceae bacterium]|nr:universal stress protein [Cyclobacteriaceae bacterium]